MAYRLRASDFEALIHSAFFLGASAGTTVTIICSWVDPVLPRLLLALLAVATVVHSWRLLTRDDLIEDVRRAMEDEALRG